MPTMMVDLTSFLPSPLQIKFNERGAKPHKIRGKESGACRQIYYLATGNNEMYKRRRMPDPLDVQQMKVSTPSQKK